MDEVNRSTRHHRCDHDFLDLLEEDFGISQFDLCSAFMGVPAAPKKQAIELCEWAIRSAAGSTEEAGHALTNWARKHGSGVPAMLAKDAVLAELHSLTPEQSRKRREEHPFWGAAKRNPGILDNPSWSL